jgi:magnesium transporter
MIEYIDKSSHVACRKIDAYQRGVWVNVEAPTAQELDQLADQFGLDRGNLHDVLDHEEVPRFERTDDHSYIFLRYAFQKKHGGAATAPLLVIVGEEILITLSPLHPDCFDKLCAADNNLATDRPTDIFLSILDCIYDEYDAYIEDISRNIQKIINKMRTHKLENEDFISFVFIEDQTGNFLGALTPMPAILRRVMVGQHTALTAEESNMVDDILLSIEQSINSCNNNLRRIVSIREAYSTLSNNSLNRSMKALTAATLIIALPNVIFGMYGMNIALPIQNEPWAYPAITGCTLLVIAVIIIVGRRRRLF